MTTPDVTVASCGTATPSPLTAQLVYWGGLPVRWGAQVFRNGSDIVRVLDVLRFRPLPAGLVGPGHPWVTGVSPHTGGPIWPSNVVYRSAADPLLAGVQDEAILLATGRFLANRVRQSAVVPELPPGPARRMPHCINYMHGSSHYNSGIVLLNDVAEAFRHVNDARFRRELRRFVASERREVLFLLRDRDYEPREYAYLSCCMRSRFKWFCNPNGPRPRVLWGNYAPFAAANMITGHWADDVYALKRTGGADAVARPPIAAGRYFQEGPYDRGRSHAAWPEKMLAWGNYYRVRARGLRGGMFFVDRRFAYADQIARRRERGRAAEERARF